MLLTDSVPAAVLAVVTTVHLSILLLRANRSSNGLKQALVLIPSAVFTATPWFLSTPPEVVIGILLHLGWFAACEKFLPAPVAPARTASPPPRQAPPPVSKQAPAPAPKGFVQVPVITVIRETEDITTFRLARPEGFEFSAGQFLTVRVNVDGQPVVRCYTISSAPEATGYLEISVKRQGLLSGTLHATIRPGSMVSIRAAAGAFTYPKGDDRPLVLLAGGVGITPMICMLRHAVQADPNRPVTLLYSVHTQRDIAFRDELWLLDRRNPQIKTVITTTRGPHATEYLSGRIDGRMLQEQVDNLRNNIFMICGPGPMIEAIKKTLAELGVPESQVRSEAFEAAIASSAAAESETPAEGPAAAAASGADFELRLIETGTTVTASNSCTLLESCEAAGLDLPAACRAGVCGTCRARLVCGRVRCESDLLDEADRAEGYILPCVSWPEEDCALEA
jgi:ferredoxin-NADP reductase